MSRNFRRNYRNKNIDSDDEAKVDSNNTKSISNNSNNTEKSIIEEKRTILSFHNESDEEIDCFKEKKSTQSKKFANKQLKEPKKRNETKTLIESSSIVSHDNQLDILVQNNLKLVVADKRSPQREPIDIKNHFEYGSSSNSANIAVNIIQKGDIPDAAAIDHVKKQRELAKQRQIQSISSSDDEKQDEEEFVSRANYATKGKKLKNPMINLMEKDRVAMVGHSDTFEKDRQMIRDSFLSIEHGSDRDSDQENEWESRLIQNAINRNVCQPRETKKIDWQLYSNDSAEAMNTNCRSNVLFELNSIGLDELTVAKLVELMMKRKEEINESKQKSNEDVMKKQQMLCVTEDRATTARAEIPILEMKYNCFNNFKKYISILVECFDEKMEKMVYLEKKFLKINKERSEKLIKRSRQDVQDQFDEIILSTKSSAIQSTYEMSNRASRISDRESRRLRRVRDRENRSIINHYDGFSSDDEEPKSALSSRQNEIEQIKVDASQLFNDTDPEYCSIEKILNEFINVKDEFENEYKDAYINGFLAHVISPLIRLELITWNPLSTPHFHKWNWFKTLVQFTKKSVGTQPIIDNLSIEYGDLKIIPTVFDKIIVPKLTEWVSIWNPLSKTETKNLVTFIGKLVSQIPSFNDGNNHVKELVKAIVCRCNECIAEDIAIPLYIEQYRENPNGLAFQFFQHQLWASIKTFTNIMMFHEIIEPNLLCKLAIEGILNNYIVTGLVILSEMGLISDVITKVTTIKHSFPEDWISKSRELNINLVEELNNLIRFVNKFGSTYRKEKTVVSFAFTILDHFKAGRGELVAMMND